jgi:hypothetical protein
MIEFEVPGYSAWPLGLSGKDELKYERRGKLTALTTRYDHTEQAGKSVKEMGYYRMCVEYNI